MPYSITGPAIVNIFAPTPKIYPSLLVSIAGETTAFANPVIGTNVPAPQYFAILSYTPIAVNKHERITNDAETNSLTDFSSILKEVYNSKIHCPIVHIIPPHKKAKKKRGNTPQHI